MTLAQHEINRTANMKYVIRRRPSRARLLLLAFLFIAASAGFTAQRTRAAVSFGLPLAGEPSLSTWFVVQWYGNTTTAYRNRDSLYRQGQGIHFGVDFAARCGTPVLAIADGIVVAVDGPYGAPPHNVVIEHANGLRSLYGHLLERSPLAIGQHVQKGQQIGLVGDPATPTCHSASHLHLEIRDRSMSHAINPVTVIPADWRRLTLGLGGDGTHFEVPYQQPNQWQTIDDQPTIRFGGPLLNDWTDAWPPR